MHFFIVTDEISKTLEAYDSNTQNDIIKKIVGEPKAIKELRLLLRDAVTLTNVTDEKHEEYKKDLEKNNHGTLTDLQVYKLVKILLMANGSPSLTSHFSQLRSVFSPLLHEALEQFHRRPERLTYKVFLIICNTPLIYAKHMAVALRIWGDWLSSETITKMQLRPDQIESVIQIVGDKIVTELIAIKALSSSHQLSIFAYDKPYTDKAKVKLNSMYQNPEYISTLIKAYEFLNKYNLDNVNYLTIVSRNPAEALSIAVQLKQGSYNESARSKTARAHANSF